MRIRLTITLLTGIVALGPVFNGSGSEAFISEIVAANNKTLKDEFGETSDWVELYNPGNIPANLLGWGLSDEPETPLKWTFPDVSIPVSRCIRVSGSHALASFLA